MSAAPDLTVVFLQRIMQPGQWTEIRSLGLSSEGRPGSLSGYFDDPARAASTARWMESIGHSVYYSINPVSPTSTVGRLVAKHRAGNTILKRAKLAPGETKAAEDKDVAYRCHLLVDVDPVRPSGCSANRSEMLAAQDVARTLKNHLKDQGWPNPIQVFSGNGFHLLYRVPRITTDAIILGCLRALASRFDTSQAHVDLGCFNPSRIARLPGILNKKGENTEERPWRRASFVEWGSDDLVTVEQLEALAALAPSQSLKAAIAMLPSTLQTDADDVDNWIDAYEDVLVVDHVGNKDGERYWSLAECPFKQAEHEGMGVGMGKTCIILGADYLGFHCFAGSCSHYTFSDLKRHLSEITGRSVPLEPYAPWNPEWEKRFPVEDAPYEFASPTKQVLERAFTRKWTL